jgi:hypothetical protein
MPNSYFPNANTFFPIYELSVNFSIFAANLAQISLTKTV